MLMPYLQDPESLDAGVYIDVTMSWMTENECWRPHTHIGSETKTCCGSESVIAWSVKWLTPGYSNLVSSLRSLSLGLGFTGNSSSRLSYRPWHWRRVRQRFKFFQTWQCAKRLPRHRTLSIPPSSAAYPFHTDANDPTSPTSPSPLTLRTPPKPLTDPA